MAGPEDASESALTCIVQRTEPTVVRSVRNCASNIVQLLLHVLCPLVFQLQLPL